MKKEAIKIGKLKLYLETTVFNYYFDEDRTGHEDVLKLFEAIEFGKFEVYSLLLENWKKHKSLSVQNVIPYGMLQTSNLRKF